MHRQMLSKIFDQLVNFLLFLLPLIYLPFFNSSFELVKITFFRVVLLLLLVVYFFKIQAEGEIKIFSIFKNRSIRAAFFLILLFIFLGTFLSVAPNLSFWGGYFHFKGGLNYILLIIFFLLLCLNFHEKEKWEKAFKWVFLGLFTTSAIGILQKLGLQIFGYEGGRVFAGFGHPNYLGSYILLLVFPLIYFYRKNRGLLFGLILTGLALFFTGNRGAFLGIFFGGIFYAFSGDKQFTKRTLLLMFSSLVFLLGSVFYYLDRIASIFIRFDTWKSSLNLVKEHLFFGHGFDTFAISFPKFASDKLFKLQPIEQIPTQAHNVFLGILSETGIFGLILLLLTVTLIGKIIFNNFRSLKKDVKHQIIAILSSLLAQFIALQFNFLVSVHFVLNAFLFAYLFFLLSENSVKKTFVLNQFSKIVLDIGLAFFVGISLILNATTLFADYKALQGFKFLVMHDEKAVIENFYSAASWQPNQSYYNYSLASVLIEAKEYKKAMEALDRASNFSNNKDFFYFYLKMRLNIKQCLENRVNCDQIDKNFNSASSLFPYYPLLFLDRGVFWVKQGECKKGMKDLQTYLKLLSDDWKDKGTEKNRIFYKHNPNFDNVFENLNMCKSANGI